MKNVLQERYLNVFTDWAFKRMFGTEMNKEFLIDFLNEVIREQGRITDVQYLKTEYLGRTNEDRNAIFDIYCTSEKGIQFLVEMQRTKQTFFKDRSLFYVTFPIQEQAAKGC